MNRVLAADISGFNRLHEISGYALAGFTPLAAFSSQGGWTEKTSDWVLGLAIPVHMHISTNALVTDYIPMAARGPARAAVLGCSLIAYLGIMKVNLAGPGLTRTVKTLWTKPQAPPS